MGRIDEALRRAGTATDRSVRPSGAGPDAGVFASPWAFRESVAAATVDGDGPIVPDLSRHVEAPARSDEAVAASVVADFPGADLRTVDAFNPKWAERLVTSPQADPQLVEQFRQLAATLHQSQSVGNTRVVMITSASAGDGKSLTTVNLGLTLSASYGRRVLLVDADLRRPSLHELAQLSNHKGLNETLRSTTEQKLPVYRLSDTLMLVPAGRPDRDPMSALTSPRMQLILQEAATRFDWILIDTPPMGPIADSSLLVPIIDAALLVVRAGQTHYAHVQKAISGIGRDRILGVVLNATERHHSDGYRHYNYYGTSSNEAR